MRDSVRDKFLQFTIPLEGSTNWMYLDEEGLVSTGYGFLIDPIYEAHTLTWRNSAGAIVDSTAVDAEWEHVKSRQDIRDLGGGAFRGITALRATLESLTYLLNDKLNVLDASFAARWPAYPSWPASAQMALLSLGWACGANFYHTWPRLSAALDAQDWRTAATECHIGAPVNPSITQRNTENTKLFLACLDPNSDPDYPYGL